MIGLSRDLKHFYMAEYPGLQQGKQPGITTVIGVMDKPALVSWAKRETAVAAIRNWDAVRTMVERPGCGYFHLTKALDAVASGRVA